MRESYKKVFGLECIIIVAILIWFLCFRNINTSNLISVVVWALILVIFQILLGIESDRTSNKIDTIQVVFLYTVTYYILTYLVGIIVGYTKTPYSLVPISIIKNVLPVLLVIILQEIFRYNVIVKCKNKLVITMLIITFVLLDIALNISHYSFTTAMDIFEVIGILIVPSIANNLLLTFMDYKAGYYPTIIYRILTECLIFIIPVVPDFNIYIQAVLKVVFPTILFLKFNTMYAKQTFSLVRRKSLARVFANVAIACVVLVIVFLVSGAFKYYAMAIGSASMTPNVNKGDAVIVEKLKTTAKLKKGMIIAFRYDKTVICHRIYKIEMKNGSMVITTKGDNNNAPDNWELERYNVIGKVNYKIPVIGWPSVWLSEFLKKR
jgi:signal peptidase